jgi:hypothetical protein
LEVKDGKIWARLPLQLYHLRMRFKS